MIKRLLGLKPSRAEKAADRPDVILHIGSPKSGSSAIQRFCLNNRRQLLQRGYYYPEHNLDKNNVSGGHTRVANPLGKNSVEKARAVFARALEDARAKHACLLLSAEAFYFQHEALLALTNGLKVQVVCFIRNPVEYFLANHNQGIKRHMGTRRLNELLPALVSRPANHLTGKPLLAWAEGVGDENCVFLPYKAPVSGGELIEAQFLRALGWADAEVEAATRDLPGMTNRSYVKSALELKRLLNTVLDELPLRSVREVDWCLQGFSDRTLNETGYSIADLPESVAATLADKLLSQMEGVVERFPQLQDIAQLPPAEAPGQGATSNLDLQAPLSALMAEVPNVIEQIREVATDQRNNGRQDYAFCKLLDLLGIDFEEPKGLAGLALKQREVLSGDKLETADCLREMALLLERQNLLNDAQFAIDQALKHRPTGQGIQTIKARIDSALNPE
ncbi:MAG: hypothetical protein AWU57_407 [Marinobacter sp. T13-3]|nr:MAG: hypothetical protein AWU57_407 [Marinobacter sp. T13-3]